MLIKSLEQHEKHVGQYQWINYATKLDLITSDRTITRIILTGFGATLDLSAAEKDNSCVLDNHSIICIFLCYQTVA